MRKLLLALIMIFCGITLSHAQSCIYGNAGCPGIGSITTVQGGGLGSTPIITTQTYTSATSITSNITTQPLPRAVWIGTSQSDDFYINGAWVTFKGATLFNVGTDPDTKSPD